jgi:hypothetical protein
VIAVAAAVIWRGKREAFAVTALWPPVTRIRPLPEPGFDLLLDPPDCAGAEMDRCGNRPARSSR